VGIKVDYKRTSQTLALPHERFLTFRLVLKLESLIYDTLLSVDSRFKRRAMEFSWSWNLSVPEIEVLEKERTVRCKFTTDQSHMQKNQIYVKYSVQRLL
jgi:hypothetical protein